MPHHDWMYDAAQTTIERLFPRLAPLLPDDASRYHFHERLNAHLPTAFRHLFTLYGWQYDFFYTLEQILTTAAHAYARRSDALKALDARREADPTWFQSESLVGAVAYVDLFAGDLAGVRDKIPYLTELGVTYLHLMPLFRTPEGNNDGGYAISDFRQVDPTLGTMDDLSALAADLREAGISLVLDFVFNHTSDEHTWAQKALDGDPAYMDFYYMFPDRTLPDQYAPHLREIFPEQSPGSFTYRSEIDRWVWTTFNDFQWDLNYSNPQVFNAMLGEMLFLANQGTEVLRLDAVAFIWKQLGTPSENLPPVHDIIRAFNALVRIAAPALVFKSEAIVHPDDVISYIAPEECPISYNPTFMALLWEALATREVKLLRHSMSRRFDLPPGTAWVNYIRVHDDIGWSFADEDAAEVGINGFDHRQFLNQFYTGRFEGSFATGLPFNFNPVTLDLRICGMAASLAGLEQALNATNADWTEYALRRIILLHSVIIAAGGIPLIYLGDEIAMLNDYSFRDDPDKRGDNRWVHRPAYDWQRNADRHDPTTPAGRVFTALKHAIGVRKRIPALGATPTLFFDSGNPHVLTFLRGGRVLVMANFSEKPQNVPRDVLGAYWRPDGVGTDLLTGEPVPMAAFVTLEPYKCVWIAQ